MRSNPLQLKPDIAEDVRFALDSFARRFATALSSFMAGLDDDAAGKLRGKDTELRDTCHNLVNKTDLGLMAHAPSTQPLPAFVEERTILATKLTPSILIAFLDLSFEAAAPHQLARQIDQMVGKHSPDIPKGVVLSIHPNTPQNQQVELIKTHTGLETPVFVVSEDSQMMHFNDDLGEPIGSRPLASIYSATFVHALYLQVIEAVEAIRPEEIDYLKQIHREQLLHT